MYNSRKPLTTPTSASSPSSPATSGGPLLAEAFKDMRTKVLQRYGKIGLKAVGQLIRSLEDPAASQGFLNADDLRSGLRDGLGVCMSDADFERIASALDTRKDGAHTINVKEFIVCLRGNVSNRRKNVIEQAFRRIDADNQGYVTLDMLYSAYDVSRHPVVLAKRAPAEQIAEKFYADFDPAQHPDGIVTSEEFINYFVGVGYLGDTPSASAATPSVNDETQFEVLLVRAFALDRPSHASALNATRTSASGQDGVSSRYNANHGVPPPPKTGFNGSLSSTTGSNTIGVIAEDGAIVRREHPLYQTAMMEYGKSATQHQHDPHHHRLGAFTKNAPPFSAGSGLNTATTRSKVI